MGRLRVTTPAAIVFLLAALVHLRTIGFDFVFDDYPLIVQNSFIHEPWSAIRSFAHSFWYGSRFGGYYRPLVVSSLAMNGWIFGWGPAGFHAVNVFLHAINAALLFVVASRLAAPVWAAGLAAAIFAAHPVGAWPVASIVARVDLLPATFVLLAWWALSASVPGAGRMALSALLFLGALLCKESALAFLLVPLMTLRGPLAGDRESSPPGPALGARVSLALSSVLVVLAYLGMRHWAAVPLFIQRLDIDPFINPLARLEWPGRLYAALELSGRYLTYLLIPGRFADPNGYGPGMSPASPFDGRVLLALALFLAWGIAILVLWLRRHRAAAPLAFALAAFLPASNLLTPIASLYAQNFLYLPLVGFCLALSCFLGRIPLGFPRERAEGRRLPAYAFGTLGLLVPLLALGSFREAGIWRSGEALFTAWSDRFPKYALAHHRLGLELIEARRPKEAVPALRRALALDDRTPETHSLLATALVTAASGPADLEAALEQTRIAAGLLAADLASARARSAQILLLLDRPAEAESEAREALRLAPDFTAARQPLAEALFRQEHYAEAAKQFKELSLLNPKDPNLRSPYVVSLLHAGILDEARKEIEKARQDFPDTAWFDFCLARLEALSGHRADALELLKRSLARDAATREWIAKVEEFKSYAGSPEFKALLEK